MAFQFSTINSDNLHIYKCNNFKNICNNITVMPRNMHTGTYLILGWALIQVWELIQGGAYIIALILQVLQKCKVLEFRYAILFMSTFYRTNHNEITSKLRIITLMSVLSCWHNFEW